MAIGSVLAMSVGWALLGTTLMKIGLAWLIALPIGWERERESHGAGLRTFSIVSMASCGYTLLAVETLDSSGLSRMLQGLVAGIGFVGGGAILKQGLTVHGTSGAASIWNTGAIGASIALGHYEIAIALALINAISLFFLTPFEETLRDRKEEENRRK